MGSGPLVSRSGASPSGMIACKSHPVYGTWVRLKATARRSVTEAIARRFVIKAIAKRSVIEVTVRMRVIKAIVDWLPERVTGL